MNRRPSKVRILEAPSAQTMEATIEKETTSLLNDRYNVFVIKVYPKAEGYCCVILYS